MIPLNVKAIVFDMDNTLLKSNINFKAMKADVYAFLTAKRAISPDTKADEHTTSTLIEAARSSDSFDEDMGRIVWQIVRDHEFEGMKAAKLEPNVEDVLRRLSGRYILTVLTNNAYDAALSALNGNGIDHYFDLIAGREQVPRLKPSPEGVLHILRKYPALLPENWICLGDSWIDGKAAMDAGIAFINYRGNISGMNERGVFPLHTIQDISELSNILR